MPGAVFVMEELGHAKVTCCIVLQHNEYITK